MGALVREAAITSDLSIIKKEAAITSALQKAVITSALVQVAVRNNACTILIHHAHCTCVRITRLIAHSLTLVGKRH